MAVIDTERTWEMVEKRLAATINERHRVVLGAVLRHMKLERDADLDGLIDTLSANPNYHFWMDGQDFGPKARRCPHLLRGSGAGTDECHGVRDGSPPGRR